MKNLLTIGSFGAKIAIVLTATVGGVALVGSSVFASLTATAFNTSAHSVTSGTLKFTQAPSGVVGLTAGFVTPVTGLAPGDTINRFVDLSNAGTLAGAAVTLGLADAGTVKLLTTDATNGLKVTVKECTVVYTLTAGVSSCSGGTETTMLSQTPAATLVSTPQLLTVAAADLVANTGVAHLKIIIDFPSTLTEVTTNGSLPSGTLQGLTSLLTWTFTETQRAGGTTNL